ncbi:MAG: FAD-binding oxidoreductase [Fimbriimonadaceae bacterium]|nr:FAD-binding oxidoreductase [Fimbriimonadaceae bacterium]
MPDLPVRSVESLAGWARRPAAPADLVRPEKIRALERLGGSTLARGMGRSYGDAALAGEAGRTVLTERLDRMLAFDPESGTLRAEAGLTLDQTLRTFVPKGFFLPVTPGTKFCSLGGCLAADVHGKNHHVAGSFSAHVGRISLIAAGRVYESGPELEPDLFWATAGGMGWTGVVAELDLRLIPIETSRMVVRHRAAPNLDAALAAFDDPANQGTYEVAWIDCLARGGSLGRSILMTGEHARADEVKGPEDQRLKPHGPPRRRVPIDFPTWALNPVTVRLFNGVYNALQSRRSRFTCHYDRFFYPLDGVSDWNRIYGKRGFVQYQFVVPPETAREAIKKVLEKISGSGHASFLAVLKRFGEGGSGLLSFPKPGWTLALDIPWREGLDGFLLELDEIVAEAGGRHYLAKDSRLAAGTVARDYERLEEFREICRRIDPQGRHRSRLSERLEVFG